MGSRRGIGKEDECGNVQCDHGNMWPASSSGRLSVAIYIERYRSKAN